MAQVSEVFLFTPTSIPTCALWMDAADSTTVTVTPGTSTVTEWRDKISSIPFGPVNGTSLSYNNSTVSLSAGTYLKNTSGTLDVGDTFTIFIMASNRTGTQGAIFYLSTLPDGFIGVYGEWPSPTNYRFTHRFPVSNFGGTTLLVPAASGILPLSMGTFYRRISGVNFELGLGLSGGTESTTLDTTSGSMGSCGQLVFGANDTLGRNLNGEIAEILFYSSFLDTADRQRVEGYLAWKWGTQASLPSTHPFKNYRPLANPPIPTQVPNMPLSTQDVSVFQPTQISGCALWLDGTDPNGNGVVPANGVSIGTWSDKSGNGRNAVLQVGFTAAVIATGPTTSNRTVLFNALSRYLITYTSFPNTAYSIFGVQYNTNNANLGGNQNGYQRILHGSQTNQYLFFGTRVGFIANFTGSGTAWNDVTETTTNNYLIWRINEMIVSGSSLTILADGTIISSKVGTTGTFSDLLLGSDNINSQPYYGNIGEIIIYSGALSTTQRQQVEGYLAWKWGLQSSLPAGHPYSVQPIAPFPFRSTAFQTRLSQWLPSQISALALWLDGADTSTITQIGGTISEWRSKGTIASVSTTTLTSAPSYTSTQQGVDFSGTQAFNLINTGALTQNVGFVSTFAVCTFRTVGELTAIFFSSTTVNTNQRYYFSIRLSGGNFVLVLGLRRLDADAGSTIFGTQAVPINQRILICGEMNYSTRVGTLYINGVGGASTLYPTAGLTSNTASVATSIANRPTSGHLNMDGIMNELLVYNVAYTTSERQQIEGYLAWKWGLQGSLPANHPFRLFPPSP